EKRPHRAKSALLDGKRPPGIADLVMAHVPGSPLEKLAWLRQQSAEGKLDGDDPEDIAQAEALLTMLVRIAGGKGSRQKRHLDDLLGGGLKQTFPGSARGWGGRFRSREAPRHPVDGAVGEATTVSNRKRRSS